MLCHFLLRMSSQTDSFKTNPDMLTPCGAKIRKMTPSPEQKLFFSPVHRAVPSCEKGINAAGRSHQSHFHANPMYGRLPCTEALKCLWGSRGPRKCRSGSTFPCSLPVSPLLPLYCSLSLPKGERAITGKPHFKHSGWI